MNTKGVKLNPDNTTIADDLKEILNKPDDWSRLDKDQRIEICDLGIEFFSNKPDKKTDLQLFEDKKRTLIAFFDICKIFDQIHPRLFIVTGEGINFNTSTIRQLSQKELVSFIEGINNPNIEGINNPNNQLILTPDDSKEALMIKMVDYLYKTSDNLIKYLNTTFSSSEYQTVKEEIKKISEDDVNRLIGLVFERLDITENESKTIKTALIEGLSLFQEQAPNTPPPLPSSSAPTSGAGNTDTKSGITNHTEAASPDQASGSSHTDPTPPAPAPLTQEQLEQVDQALALLIPVPQPTLELSPASTSASPTQPAQEQPTAQGQQQTQVQPQGPETQPQGQQPGAAAPTQGAGHTDTTQPAPETSVQELLEELEELKQLGQQLLDQPAEGQSQNQGQQQTQSSQEQPLPPATDQEQPTAQGLQPVQ